MTWKLSLTRCCRKIVKFSPKNILTFDFCHIWFYFVVVYLIISYFMLFMSAFFDFTLYLAYSGVDRGNLVLRQSVKFSSFWVLCGEIQCLWKLFIFLLLFEKKRPVTVTPLCSCATTASNVIKLQIK